ncbi:hypothetical protein P152DRAFT_485607 [Eremomyces bilateralis CBS 781.70]|uniref:Actin-like ATPase domain-containing protein n=1 Tax=Eremomyces bilateralis CBS 781.70 TaxID=1392243 RepID=A0A6G1FR90_9PEZI|nr:uncharacterized protein P152DRAFT_485607 [Eremomyces bilateralis CBS 781.70]KAF1808248.1 hypothetical protein P152DRAFT_485607 [Eremomyces bilateralis CBS 781.70]
MDSPRVRERDAERREGRGRDGQEEAQRHRVANASESTRHQRGSIFNDMPVRRRAQEPKPQDSETAAPLEGLKPGPRVLLGIDYGTTFTGVAWVQQDDALVKSSIQDITVFPRWPGVTEVEENQEKVPSEFSYSAAKNREKQWGYSMDKDSLILRWTKLELMLQSPETELAVLRNLLKGLSLLQQFQESGNRDYELPKHLRKNAGEIIEDYLDKVAKEWRAHMMATAREALREVPLDIVVTHPLIWDYHALNATITAVRHACHKGLFPHIRDFYVVQEPEACALSTTQDMLAKSHPSVIEGECFVLVDAGGGTVDIATYCVENIDPFKLSLIEKDDGSESRCGATFVDRAFLEWLEPKLANVHLFSEDVTAGGHSVFSPLTSLLLKRFKPVKEAFDSTDKGNIQLPQTYRDADNRLHTLKPAEAHKFAIKDGVVKLSHSDLEHIFEKSVNTTIGMIRRQVRNVEMKRRPQGYLRVENIFMSGGFAQNPYLYKKVKEYADSTAHIGVQRADNCWTAVVQGALLKGMGIGSEVATKVEFCPRHYGICLSEFYEDWRPEHDDGKAVNDRFHLRKLIPGQIIWAAKRGDVIIPGSPIKSSIPIEGHTSKNQHKKGYELSVTFVATTLPEAPANISELKNGNHEIKNLVVNMGAIPRYELREQKKAKGSISPLFALSITAARWGLEPFPANLVAIQGRVNTSITNSVVEAWTLPYSCGGLPLSGLEGQQYYNYSSYYQEPPSPPYRSNISLTNICDAPQACPASDCRIVVEGAGRTQVDTIRTSIISLVHGISASISVLGTFGLFMMFEALTKLRPKKKKGGLSGADLEPFYNAPYGQNAEGNRAQPPPPPLYPPGHEEDGKAAAAKAKGIARCADLLRRKYELDMEIWGSRRGEETRRAQLQRKSDAIFREIWRSVQGMRASNNWTREEWDSLEEISNTLDAHNAINTRR